MKDEQEHFELMRDIAEHNAMFTNPEGVSQIREAREKTFTVNDQDFEAIIEQNFGKKLEKKEIKPERTNISQINPDKYLNVDLDEIKFIPFKE